MTLYTCNDHKNAAVVFTDPDCPLCAAIEYHDTAEEQIVRLNDTINDLQEEIVSLKDEE